eukprot:TRINITY_DN59306_c0_g1_i1.p1 TRINITY_DN59306_c0_g1~~TRINITY_DN59306_c0_g1_i1.p1  ORF type:complete len:537 (-),score=101.90 TRINITY_DN59306_c0_g1_i1:77-1666(-)
MSNIFEVFRQADKLKNGTVSLCEMEELIQTVANHEETPIELFVSYEEVLKLLKASPFCKSVSGYQEDAATQIDYVAFLEWLGFPVDDAFGKEKHGYAAPGLENLTCTMTHPAAADVAETLLQRGFSVRQLIKFVKGHHNMFIMDHMSSSEVVGKVILPETRSQCCAMVELFDRTVLRPGCLMSHCWGAPFMSLVAGIMAHASGQVLAAEELCSQDQLEKTYWTCIFSVNHHRSICGSKWYPCECGAEKCLDNHPSSEIHIDVLALMMQQIPAHAVALDNNHLALTRIWVLQELQVACSLGLTSEFISTTGLSSDALVSVKDAKASREEDRCMILAHISNSLGVAAFDALTQRILKAEVVKYQFMDAVACRDIELVRGLLVGASELCNTQMRHLGFKTPLHLLCERTKPFSDKEWVATCSVADAILDAKADVHLRDMAGQTSLHIACVQREGTEEMSRKLLDAGADVNLTVLSGRWTGKTPLECLMGSLEVDRCFNRAMSDNRQELVTLLKARAHGTRGRRRAVSPVSPR